MQSYLAGLEIYIFAWTFIYFPTPEYACIECSRETVHEAEQTGLSLS